MSVVPGTIDDGACPPSGTVRPAAPDTAAADADDAPPVVAIVDDSLPDRGCPDGRRSADSLPDNPWIVSVAVSGPLPLLDYRHIGAPPAAGVRVQVPLGRRTTVGLVVRVGRETTHVGALRPLTAILDAAPVVPASVLDLLLWAATYYHHAPGDGVMHGLPRLLRSGATPTPQRPMRWRAAVAHAEFALRRAPAQAAALTRLQALPDGCDDADLVPLGISRDVLRALLDKALVTCTPDAAPPQFAAHEQVQLTAEQTAARHALIGALGSYRAFVLQGVTGSGKTEIYLQAIAEVLRRGGQALVLVPEIALTPQTLARFIARFPRTVVSHSAVSETERARIHLRCLAGELDVLIGTRSAIFAPLPRLGLIVVDEEHDTSFKQQDGFRYSARDLAIKRARDQGIPVVLGSATPALETLHNASRGRYRTLRLTARPGRAALPALRIVDVRGEHLEDGLSQRLISAIGQRIHNAEQALIFLNRRGFAPTLQCQACGWIAQCPHCDARLSLHRQPPQLLCHHCDTRQLLPRQCPDCHAPQLLHRGVGTQRLEDALLRAFPDTPILRIDRDVARRKDRLEQRFDIIRSGQPAILVGTQMLAKGHHFPGVTLAAVVNADGGLFSSDYRGPERTAQIIVQVAGRAGRDERPGELWLQTCHPEHPVIAALAQGGYEAFAALALAERADVGLPPFTALAMLRADAPLAETARHYLEQLRAAAPNDKTVQLRGPVPAPVERRADRHRFQLAVFSRNRPALHRMLTALLDRAAALPGARRVRFSVDVDPVDIF